MDIIHFALIGFGILFAGLFSSYLSSTVEVEWVGYIGIILTFIGLIISLFAILKMMFAKEDKKNE